MMITRDNWEDHCTVPALTNEEWREWRALHDSIRGDKELQGQLGQATRDKHTEPRLAAYNDNPDDWSDVVARADAARRLMHAELKWMREHVGPIDEPEPPKETDND